VEETWAYVGSNLHLLINRWFKKIPQWPKTSNI